MGIPRDPPCPPRGTSRRQRDRILHGSTRLALTLLSPTGPRAPGRGHVRLRLRQLRAPAAGQRHAPPLDRVQQRRRVGPRRRVGRPAASRQVAENLGRAARAARVEGRPAAAVQERKESPEAARALSGVLVRPRDPGEELPEDEAVGLGDRGVDAVAPTPRRGRFDAAELSRRRRRAVATTPRSGGDDAVRRSRRRRGGVASTPWRRVASVRRRRIDPDGRVNARFCDGH